MAGPSKNEATEQKAVDGVLPLSCSTMVYSTVRLPGSLRRIERCRSRCSHTAQTWLGGSNMEPVLGANDVLSQVLLPGCRFGEQGLHAYQCDGFPKQICCRIPLDSISSKYWSVLL